MLRAICTLFAASLLFACGSPRRSEPLVGAPQLASVQERHGEVLFFRFCHQCHPGGEAGLGPSINNKPPMPLVRLQVRKGLGAMPAFPEAIIPERDLDALLAYFDRLREHPED
jgi:mono/diheme cytochrome c family protein